MFNVRTNHGEFSSHSSLLTHESHTQAMQLVSPAPIQVKSHGIESVQIPDHEVVTRRKQFRMKKDRAQGKREKKQKKKNEADDKKQKKQKKPAESLLTNLKIGRTISSRRLATMARARKT